MHHFRRRSHLILHRFNALSWLLMLLLVLMTVGLLVAALLTNDRLLALAGLSLASASLMVAILQRIAASSANCPLCRMPPLGSRACQKNAKARPFLGSYRLRVSLSTVLLNRFRCPYCGEPTRCTVKIRRPEDPSESTHPNAFLNPFR
jgi:hypothetical protein